ncbi:hypothetical protein U3516DRAFT_735496 [Neocallimastix sp. 'constans']
MTFDNALKVATAVAATEMASGSKRKRVSKGKESAEAGNLGIAVRAIAMNQTTRVRFKHKPTF